MKQTSIAALIFLVAVLASVELSSAQSMMRASPGTGGGSTARAPAFAPSRPSQPVPPPHHPNRFVFPDSFDRDRDVSVSVGQTQQTYQPQAEKPSNKKYYVPPRWVVTDQGVEVLMPGFWTDDPKLAGIESPRAAQRVLPEY